MQSLISRTNTWFVALALAAVLIGSGVALPVGIQAGRALTPRAGPETAGYYYAWSTYKTEANGVQAVLLVTNPTPASGSVVANFVNINFDNGAWFQAGWVKGQTPGGSTGSNVNFYFEYCTLRSGNTCVGTYHFSLLGVAPVNTQHTFWVSYQMRTVNQWFASIDGTVPAGASNVQFSYSYGWPDVEAESHNSVDKMSGHVYSLQYVVNGPRGPRFFPWDGYGSYGADPPVTQYIISNTEWTFSENL